MTAPLRRWDTWLLAPAPAERLAGLRVLIGGFVLVYLVANVFEFRRIAAQPSAPFEPIGPARVLNEPVAAGVVWIWFGLLLVIGSAFVAGVAFRVTGPAFAVLVLGWASYHSPWGQLLHFEHLFSLHLVVLGLAPAAATWSVDARSAAERPKPHTRYGWPIRLLALMTATTYVLAGLAKIRQSGFDWIDGSTLGNHVAYSATRIDLLGGFEPPLASVIVGRPWLIAPMATVALAIELCAPAALIGDRLRNTWVGLAVLFHLGTAATMMVWFPYQGLAFAMLPLFRVEQLISRTTADRVGETEPPVRRSVATKPKGTR